MNEKELQRWSKDVQRSLTLGFIGIVVVCVHALEDVFTKATTMVEATVCLIFFAMYAQAARMVWATLRQWLRAAKDHSNGTE